jgi:hypothetical protein
MANGKKTTAKTATKKRTESAVSPEEIKAAIAKRAKDNFLKRQSTHGSGDALSDWLAAEKEIEKEYKID